METMQGHYFTHVNLDWGCWISHSTTLKALECFSVLVLKIYVYDSFFFSIAPLS